jgi:hypothetical protein
MLLMWSLTSPISSTDAERLSTASVIAFASLVAWRNCRRICDAGCDMFDRLGDFLGGRRDYSDIRCRLFRRCRGGEGLFLIARGAGRHVTRGTVHGNCRPIEGFGDVGYRPLEFPGGGFDELPARSKCAGLFALLAAAGRRVRGCLAKEYEGAPHIRDFIAPGAKTDAYPGAKYRSSTMAAPRRMQREAAARRQALRAARDPLGGHPVLDQADDRRKDRTGNSAAGELANERADID